MTMAAARIVMSDWGYKWRCILEKAGITIGMLDGYVDDVRQKSSCLRYGTRWDTDANKFMISEEARKEDLRLRREEKETSNAMMVRVCLPAINQVNTDLVFTAEIPEEFPDSKLPTLDFFLWLEKSRLLNHSYFQKSMRTPLLIMASSAMGQQQRYSILSNEMIRRLSNTKTQKMYTGS